MQKMNDPCIAPSPFKEEVFEHYRTKEKLTIGYFSYNEVSVCSKPALIALNNAVDVLKKEGHTLIEIDTSFLKDLLNIL